MNCVEAVRELGAYLDGQVAADVGAGLDAHLASCAPCRMRFAREARFEGAVAHALRSSPDQPLDDAAWKRALAVATATAAGPSAPAPWWARLRHPPSRSQLRWFALVASLALLATFSMAGLGLRRSLHATAPPASQQQTVPGSSR